MTGRQLEFTHLATLSQARERTLSEAADGGVVCPCCGRFLKVYRRRLHAEMARFLIRLYGLNRLNPGRVWRSTREVLGARGGNKASTDATYLVHWGLVERAPAENPAGAPAGSFRLTPLGVAFVEARATVPSHVSLLNNEPVITGHVRAEVTIRSALGRRFNYDDLMIGEGQGKI
jgi:hypothetical protein